MQFIHKYSPIEQPGISLVEQPGISRVQQAGKSRVEQPGKLYCSVRQPDNPLNNRVTYIVPLDNRIVITQPGTRLNNGVPA